MRYIKLGFVASIVLFIAAIAIAPLDPYGKLAYIGLTILGFTALLAAVMAPL